MNALVFDIDGNLFIRKENGLEYTFENVDAPALGFEYAMVVYDGDEFKIVQWDEQKPFEEQLREPLSDSEKEMLEQYIGNSEPPEGVSLAGQHITRLEEMLDDHVNSMARDNGFGDLMNAVYAGREGSNHPYRSNARRVLEFADAQHAILANVAGEIHSTREDFLKPFDEYVSVFPTPTNLPDHPY